MYYQDSTITYEPIGRQIKISDVIIGTGVRFSYPDYSYVGNSSVKHLDINEIYIISDYTVYMDNLSLHLSKFPGECFDCKLFTLAENNYIIPFGMDYTRFYYEKIKRRMGKFICS